MDQHYFNTAGESTEKAAEYANQAKDQEAKIIHFIQVRKLKKFKTLTLFNELFTGSVPYTSVGRAITKLKDQGYIKDSGERGKGRYNRKVIIWEVISLAPTEPGKKTLRQKIKDIDKDKLQELSDAYIFGQQSYTARGSFEAGAMAILELLEVKL